VETLNTAQSINQSTSVSSLANSAPHNKLLTGAERQSARMSKIYTNDDLTRFDTGRFTAVPIWQQWASKGWRMQQDSYAKSGNRKLTAERSA